MERDGSDIKVAKMSKRVDSHLNAAGGQEKDDLERMSLQEKSRYFHATAPAPLSNTIKRPWKTIIAVTFKCDLRVVCDLLHPGHYVPILVCMEILEHRLSFAGL